MKIKVVNCVEWKAPDRPGELLRFAASFEAKGVNLDILWSCGGGGRIGATAKQPAKLSAALRGMGVKAKSSKCFYLTGKDKAGALVGILGKLSAAKIYVDYCSALAAQGNFGAILWVKDSAFAKAKKLLKA